MRIWIAVFLMLSMAGCAGRSLSADESTLLDDLLQGVGQIRGQYREFAKLDENIERGVNFVSYAYDLGQSHSTPLMNPDYFWFKISLVNEPVEAADLQPPVLTIFIPQFKKYLKLRISSANKPLTTDLVNIFYKRALSAGGTDARWGANNAQSMSSQRGFGRRG